MLTHPYKAFIVSVRKVRLRDVVDLLKVIIING